MARKINNRTGMIRGQAPDTALTCAFDKERVTRIEPALSAWEYVLIACDQAVHRFVPAPPRLCE